MNTSKSQPYFLFVLLAGAFVLAFFIYRPFLIELALAAIFATVLQPIYRTFSKWLRGWNGTAALATVVLCLVCIFGPLYFVGSQVTNEARMLYATFAAGGDRPYFELLSQHMEGMVRHLPGMESYTADFAARASALAKTAIGWVAQNLGSVFSSAVQLLLGFVIFVIALFFFLTGGAGFKRGIIELSPLGEEDNKTIFERLEKAVNSIIRGSLTVALLQAITTSIGLAISGVPNSLLWGLMAGFSALIPGLSIWPVIIPSVLYLYITGASVHALILIVWGILSIAINENVIGPKLVGKGTQLPPVVVLLSALGGIAFFGPAGIFLGPLSISFLVVLLTVYSKS